MNLAVEKKEIGKIQLVEFGFGGYQDAMIGVTFRLGGLDWGVTDFKGFWRGDPTEHTKWSREQQINDLGGMVLWFSQLLRDAGKTHLDQLHEVPIEATFVNNSLRSWRILREVL